MIVSSILKFAQMVKTLRSEGLFLIFEQIVKMQTTRGWIN
jgi:hypothetical protein